MPRAKADPGVFATSLPRITDVRNELGYPDPEAPFNDDIKSFRKKFHTIAGVSGLELYDWKSQDHQDGLIEMADAFLDQHGSFYFSDSKPLNLLADEQRIKWLIKVLFFKLNENKFRNNKYKAQRKTAPSSPGRKTRRRRRKPAETDVVISIETSPSLPPPATPERPLSPTARLGSDFTSAFAEHIDPSLRNDSNDTQYVSFRGDYFNEPEILEAQHTNRLTASLINVPNAQSASVRLPPPPNVKRRHEPADAEDLGRYGKRPRLGTDESDHATYKPSRIVKLQVPPGIRMAWYRTFDWAVPPASRSQERLQDGPSMGNATPMPREAQPNMTKNTPRAGVKDCVTPQSEPPLQSESPLQREPPLRNEPPWRNEPPLQSESPLQREPPLRNKPPLQNEPPLQNKSLWQNEAPLQNEVLLQKESPAVSIPGPPSTDFEYAGSFDKSSYDLDPFVAPSRSTTSEPYNQSRRASELSVPKKPLAKPSVNFSYRVILSRKPRFRCMSWIPNGKFQDKSLSELIRELNIGRDIEALVFNLEGADGEVQAEYQIPCDRDSEFETMKHYFSKQIKACVARHPGGSSPLRIEIEIEPLRVAGTGGGDNSLDTDDVDIGW